MTQKLTLTVGIPAYNEAANIGECIKSVLNQDTTSFILEKILVICDGCTDNTFKIIKELAEQDSRLVIKSEEKRMGKLYRLNQIYEFNESDFIFTLDADVVLSTPFELMEVLNVASTNEKTVVVAANQIPLKPRTIIGKALYVNHIMWNKIRLSLNNGDHVFNLQGSASLIRGSFAKTVKYPADITCDQNFLYFSAKQVNGFKYSFNNRVVYWPIASVKDLRLQGSRALKERMELTKYFGADICNAYRIPLTTKLRAIYETFVEHPIYTIMALSLNMLLRVIPYADPLRKMGVWQMAQTTKYKINIGV